MQNRLAEPRVVTIEGRRTLVTERVLPIPPTLELLLEGGSDARGTWAPLRIIERLPLVLSGARGECLAQDHRIKPWIEGLHVGSDGRTRSLALLACQDCGAVCVRDRSYDSLAILSGDPRDLSTHRAMRRKDHVLGWYSGGRPRQRIYT
jgi:hypothetical protein